MNEILYICFDPFEADLAEGLLEDEGVPVQRLGDAFTTDYASGALSEIVLFVPLELFNHSRDLILAGVASTELDGSGKLAAAVSQLGQTRPLLADQKAAVSVGQIEENISVAAPISVFANLEDSDD